MFTKNRMFYHLVRMNPKVKGEEIQRFVDLIWDQLNYGRKAISGRDILNYLFKIYQEYTGAKKEME